LYLVALISSHCFRDYNTCLKLSLICLDLAFSVRSWQYPRRGDETEGDRWRMDAVGKGGRMRGRTWQNNKRTHVASLGQHRTGGGASIG
jgi:hypothetical protein